MSWRLAKSLETLRSQINTLAPNRDKSSDGTIGDARHQASTSDHNPNSAGVVCAMDITHDPRHGIDAGKVADILRQSHDNRIKYLISNRRIASSGVYPWIWRRYTGSNPHDKHFHISVKGSYDDPRPWKLELSPLIPATRPEPSAGDPKFHSLVPGGFFSSTPFDKTLRTSVRTNNPGALNVAEWVRKYPGYVGDKVTSGTNSTVIFESPEHGIAAWWELLHRYRTHDNYRPFAKTLKDIIIKYGGGQANYPAYAETVVVWTGLKPDTEIKLEDDVQLLKFAKAMFRYESGLRVAPWTDEQILYGFKLARQQAGVPVAVASNMEELKKPGLIARLFGEKSV